MRVGQIAVKADRLSGSPAAGFRVLRISSSPLNAGSGCVVGNDMVPGMGGRGRGAVGMAELKKAITKPPLLQWDKESGVKSTR